MEKRDWLIEAIKDFQPTYPAQFHLPCHSGRYSSTLFKELEDDFGPKKIDGSWFALYNVNGIEMIDGRLMDLGPKYHEIFNSQLTLFLQNGSTLGNQILCMSLGKKKVLVQNNSHISVYIGLQLAGAIIVQVQQEHNQDFDIFLPISAGQVQNSLQEHPDIAAVYLTSPNHEGLSCDYAAIKQVCGTDRIFIVDEAHGSHFYFGQGLPQGALQKGADASITSIHKNIGSLSATSMIQISKTSKLSAEKVKDTYMMLSTTSPSPYLLADAEGCIRSLLDNKLGLIKRAIELNTNLRQRISEIPFVQILEMREFIQDPTKLIFRVRGLNGTQLYKHLDKHRVNVEKSTHLAVISTTHINIHEQDVQRLIDAVLVIAGEFGKEDDSENVPEVQQIVEMEHFAKAIMSKREFRLDIRDVISSDTQFLEAKECLGRISAEIKSASPPGYPVLLYGEVIRQEHIEIIGSQKKIKVVV